MQFAAMRVLLNVIAGPHKGLEFAFDQHDTFLVGRSKHAHFQLPAKDKYFSRIHFMLEVNPPECRLIDMGSHNGTFVNGSQVFTADLKDGDQIRAGHTILRVQVKRISATPTSSSTIRFHHDLAVPVGLPVIPGYTLERELGRGVMGVTYLAQRVGHPLRYAIKVVRPATQATDAHLHEFLRYVRMLTRLDHAHILRLREADVCPAGLYFVTDYFASLSMTELLKRDGPLSVKRTVRIANQILHALLYAHAHHFVHRDIKPGNILIGDIDGKETVMLADFGVGRLYQTAPFSGLGLTASLLDLVSFIPPEVLFNFHDVNPAADQYSTAAVLYHLLTATPALEMPTAKERRYSSMLRRLFVPLTERRGDLPPALADAIHKALARSVSQRHAGIAEFRQAILAAI